MISFDLNDYPDIDYDEFIGYVEHHFKIPVPYIGFLNGKYDVIFEFHKDKENNKFSISAKIEDYSKVPIDDALQEALEDINKKKRRIKYYDRQDI